MSRERNRLTALKLFLLLSVILSGCSLLPKEEEALTPPLVKPVQENYSTAKAEKGTITQEIKGNGKFESTAQDEAIYKDKNGRISRIHVVSGDVIKKGDILVELLLDGLDIQLQEQEIAVEKAKYALREAKMNEGNDEKTLDLASLQFKLEQKKYDRLSEQYDSRIIRSEVNGKVTFVDTLKEGDIIEPYRTIVSVADPAKLRVVLEVDSSENNIAVGLDVLLNYKSTTFNGTVVQSPLSAPVTQNKDQANRNNRFVYINMDELPPDADIGTIIDVRIITEQRDNIIKIPKGGLRSFGGRNFVRILEDGSKIREIDVEPGIKSSTEVEIVKGLEEGQVVILQ
ncbi:macrolide transporter subunit MacA [compost metagenome]